jgi:hypothetical protein
VDERDLIARAGKGLTLAGKRPAAEKVLDGGDLSKIFELEMAPGAGSRTRTAPREAKPGHPKALVGKNAKTARSRSRQPVRRPAGGARKPAGSPAKKRPAAKR